MGRSHTLTVVKLVNQDKGQIARTILEALPEWFGKPDSLTEYVEAVEKQVMFVAFVRGEPVGFVALEKHNAINTEMAVLGALPHYHRKGVGRAIIEKVIDFVKAEGGRFVTVKTIAEEGGSAAYDETRKFYIAMGFEPLELFPDLWDPWNPCLLMIREV